MSIMDTGILHGHCKSCGTYYRWQKPPLRRDARCLDCEKPLAPCYASRRRDFVDVDGEWLTAAKAPAPGVKATENNELRDALLSGREAF